MNEENRVYYTAVMGSLDELFDPPFSPRPCTWMINLPDLEIVCFEDVDSSMSEYFNLNTFVQ